MQVVLEKKPLNGCLSVKPRLHDTTCCQRSCHKHSTGCQSGLTTGCIVYTAGCQTGVTTGWMFVYTIQPVVKPVVQSVVSYKWGISQCVLRQMHNYLFITFTDNHVHSAELLILSGKAHTICLCSTLVNLPVFFSSLRST